MKVLIAGSRHWSDREAIAKALQKFPQDTTIVLGACPSGADAIADAIAQRLGFEIHRYPADWHIHGKKAGPIRNEYMLRLEHDESAEPVDMMLAFVDADSKGTKDCMCQQRKCYQ